ncbi:YrhB domain-containing protein [Streptomyces niveus]|uniref:YrhB domain-containing protein n=1 Tax=Streptomyces niveus TaxID=193462 RepID=UPI003416F27A
MTNINSRVTFLDGQSGNTSHAPNWDGYMFMRNGLMISEGRAREIADELLQASRTGNEPELRIDWPQVRVKEGFLIAPYNSARFLETRDMRDQLLDCWPILVDMRTEQARFGELEERNFWRNP